MEGRRGAVWLQYWNGGAVGELEYGDPAPGLRVRLCSGMRVREMAVGRWIATRDTYDVGKTKRDRITN